MQTIEVDGIVYAPVFEVVDYIRQEAARAREQFGPNAQGFYELQSLANAIWWQAAKEVN